MEGFLSIDESPDLAFEVVVENRSPKNQLMVCAIYFLMLKHRHDAVRSSRSPADALRQLNRPVREVTKRLPLFHLFGNAR